jgi:hypothetical protein
MRIDKYIRMRTQVNSMRYKIEEIENLTLNILLSEIGKKHTVKALYDIFREKYPNYKVSYSFFLRTADVLIAKKRVKSEDFGFVRFLWC